MVSSFLDPFTWGIGSILESETIHFFSFVPAFNGNSDILFFSQVDDVPVETIQVSLSLLLIGLHTQSAHTEQKVSLNQTALLFLPFRFWIVCWQSVPRSSPLWLGREQDVKVGAMASGWRVSYWTKLLSPLNVSVWFTETE